jgi:anthranilate phosphoribosyltransferase
MAETLKILGSEKAWLVHGSDGTDEISISGSTSVVELSNGNISEFEIRPEDAGLKLSNFEDIKGGTPKENASAFTDLLEGKPSAYRDSVLLNSAAALLVSDKVTNLKEGVEMAKDSIDSGIAKEKVSLLANLTTGN